ncbi:hypothetical protein BH09SUM1_BH09SUM1_29930 [soil metagenome]
MTQESIDLNLLRIKTPCPVAWDSMIGDDRVRHCGICRKNVYNTSEMKADEVRSLIVETQGKLCARLYQRQDGTLITADCATTRRRRAAVFAMTLLGAILTVGASALASTAGASKPKAVTTDSIERFARTHQPAKAVINWLCPQPAMTSGDMVYTVKQ